MRGKGKGKSQTQTPPPPSSNYSSPENHAEPEKKKELFFSRVSFPTAKSNFINEPTGLTEREEEGRREASIR